MLALPCPDLGNASLTQGDNPAFSILLHRHQSWAVSWSPSFPSPQLNKLIFHCSLWLQAAELCKEAGRDTRKTLTNFYSFDYLRAYIYIVNNLEGHILRH